MYNKFNSILCQVKKNLLHKMIQLLNIQVIILVHLVIIMNNKNMNHKMIMKELLLKKNQKMNQKYQILNQNQFLKLLILILFKIII